MYRLVATSHRKWIALADRTGELLVRPLRRSHSLPDHPKKVLILFLHGLGDAVLCSGFFRSLKSRFPESEIHILTSSRSREYLEIGKWFHRIREMAEPKESFSRLNPRKWMRLYRAFAKLRHDGYELLIDPYGSFVSNMMAWFSGIPVRLAHGDEGGAFFLTHAAFRKHVHQGLAATEIAEALGMAGACEGPALPPLSATGPPPTMRRPYAIIAPGTLLRSKRWPSERFAELGRRISAGYHLAIVLVGSASERQLCDSIAAGIGGGCESTAGRLKLAESISVIRACRLFVGNDSGLAHIARALERPLVQVFGPSLPEAFGYRDDRAGYCRPGDCEHRPCSPYRCLKGDQYCIDDISVEDVEKEIARIAGPGGFAISSTDAKPDGEPE